MKSKTEILSKADMDKIHAATLKVLWDTGIVVNHVKAREILKEAGCEVDDKTGVVKFPAKVVESAIKKVPESFMIYSRDGKHNVEMVSDGSKTHNMTFGVGVKLTEYVSPGKYRTRDGTLEDLAKIAKVTDACENIDWFTLPISAMDLVGKECARTLYETVAIVANSSKPILLDPDPEYLQEYFDIECACYDGDKERAKKEPFFIVGGCPTSPLQLDHHACELAVNCGKYGFPMMCLSMAMGAASAPIYLAGTLVVHNAEVLSAIVITQLANPGMPTIYGSSTTSFDFYCDSAPVGSPELALISAGVAEMAKYYRMPSIVAGT